MRPAGDTKQTMPHLVNASTLPARPNINVTPLIDVLLVLLIIFMVVAPLKMGRFKVQVPQPPDEQPLAPAPDTLVVTIRPDRTLMLNKIADMGSVDAPDKLVSMLADAFQERKLNHDYVYDLRDRVDLPEELRIQKTVFIKAPRALPYGDVARVLDAIKGAGASPVGLQIDELE